MRRMLYSGLPVQELFLLVKYCKQRYGDLQLGKASLFVASWPSVMSGQACLLVFSVPSSVLGKTLQLHPEVPTCKKCDNTRWPRWLLLITNYKLTTKLEFNSTCVPTYQDQPQEPKLAVWVSTAKRSRRGCWRWRA